MAILQDENFANYVLENQQKEIRAYDQKAGYYIASNSGLFVIALFTLCVFTMFHGDYHDFEKLSIQWWMLLVITSIYLLFFLASSVCCFGVLFARTAKKDRKTSDIMKHSITNPLAVDLNNFDNDLKETESNIAAIQEEHIKANISILKKKHFFANAIPYLSIAMGLVFLALTILLFIF